MADAVYMQILERVEALMKGLAFPAFGDCSPIRQENIFLRDAPVSERDDREDWKDEDVPCLVIVPSSVIERPDYAGTNSEDDITYQVMLQFCDQDVSRFNRNRLRTHLKWIQDSARTLHGYDWTAKDFDGGCPVISWSKSTNVIDESKFWKHRYFVRGTIVEFLSREPRTVL